MRKDNAALRLCVTSDGTLVGTQVVNAQTGELLEHVPAVTWTLDADAAHDGLATATLIVRRVQIEVAGDATIHERTVLDDRQAHKESHT